MRLWSAATSACFLLAFVYGCSSSNNDRPCDGQFGVAPTTCYKLPDRDVLQSEGWPYWLKRPTWYPAELVSDGLSVSPEIRSAISVCSGGAQMNSRQVDGIAQDLIGTSKRGNFTYSEVSRSFRGVDFSAFLNEDGSPQLYESFVGCVTDRLNDSSTACRARCDAEYKLEFDDLMVHYESCANRAWDYCDRYGRHYTQADASGVVPLYTEVRQCTDWNGALFAACGNGQSLARPVLNDRRSCLAQCR